MYIKEINCIFTIAKTKVEENDKHHILLNSAYKKNKNER